MNWRPRSASGGLTRVVTSCAFAVVVATARSDNVNSVAMSTTTPAAPAASAHSEPLPIRTTPHDANAVANTTLSSGVATLSFALVNGDITLTALAAVESGIVGANLVANASTSAEMWAFGVVGQDGLSQRVTSRDSSCSTRTIDSRRDANGDTVAVLTWHGVAMLATNATVVVTVRLPVGSDTSMWSLRATNHDPSRDVGLWNSSLFFNGLRAGPNDTVFRPSGFGQLIDSTLTRCACASYPSNAATMQVSALGGSADYGVYTAALDAGALPKTLAFGTRAPQWPAGGTPGACPNECRALVVGSDDAAATIYSGCVFGPSGAGSHSANTSADFAYVVSALGAGARWSTFSSGFEYALGVIPLDGALAVELPTSSAADPVGEARRRALWWEAAQR